jgi:WXG100 family type VII secretion target
MADNGAFIKFDPERISLVAANLEKQQALFVKSAADIHNKSESLMANWQGSGAAAYGEEERKLYERGGELAKALLTFSQNLATVSGIYKTGESAAKQEAESLPVDGVFLV